MAAAVAVLTALVAWTSCGPTLDAPPAPGATPSSSSIAEPEHASPVIAAATPRRVVVAADAAKAATLRNVRGAVRDAKTDAPLAGANVRAFVRARAGDGGTCGILDPPPAGTPDAETSTAADGTFEFALSGSSVLVAATAPGHRGAATYATSDEPVVLDLAAGADHEFTVVDEHQRPIAGAEVTVYDEGVKGPPAATTRTGADGHAHLVVAERNALLVVAEGFETQAVSWAASQTKPIVMQRGTEIGGVVVEKDDRPVAGARVEVDHPFRPYEVVATDADGRFRVVGIGLGSMPIVHVHADGFADVTLYPVAGDGAIRVVLSRGARIKGVVVFSDGTPAADADVSVQSPDGLFGSGTSVNDGSFAFGPVPAGEFTFFAGTRYDQAPKTPVVFPRAGHFKGPLSVPDGGVVAPLRVVLSDDPISYFRVRIVGDGGAAVDPKPFRVTGAPQRALWATPDGDLVVAAQAPVGTGVDVGFTRSPTGPTPLPTRVLTSSAPDCDAVVVWLAPSQLLTVIVRDPDGGELPPGVQPKIELAETYWWRKCEAVATSRDRVSWRITRGGTYLAGVAAKGWATQRVAIEPFDGESAEREIRLVPEAVMRGRVVDAAGGPARDSYVAVGTLADEGRRQWFAAKSFDVTGRFEIPALPPGAAELVVRTRDSVLVLRRRVDVAAGAVLDAGTIEMPADVLIRGVVRDSDGRAVGGATVRCDAGENLGPTTVTTPDGAFALTASRGFPAAILARKHGLATGIAWFDGGRDPPPFDVRLAAEARISVVRPANGYGSLWVRTSDGRATWQPEFRHDDGALELDGIPPGRIVVVFDPGGTERTREVVAVAGKTVVVRFDE
jgi:hypothetical protein